MKRFAVAVIVLIAGIFVNTMYSMPEARQPRRPLVEFPRSLGDWRAVADQKIDEKSMSRLLVDDYLLRTYRNSSGEVLNLYIGYFEMQREGKQVHSPRQCLPGGGWRVVSKEDQLLPAAGGIPQDSSANFFLMGKDEDRDLFLWWYQGRGRAYANEYAGRAYRLWDALTKRRTDEAMVRVNMSVTGDVERTRRTELDFVALLAAPIAEFLPE
jgi:EpsI family protein